MPEYVCHNIQGSSTVADKSLGQTTKVHKI